MPRDLQQLRAITILCCDGFSGCLCCPGPSSFSMASTSSVAFVSGCFRCSPSFFSMASTSSVTFASFCFALPSLPCSTAAAPECASHLVSADPSALTTAGTALDSAVRTLLLHWSFTPFMQLNVEAVSRTNERNISPLGLIPKVRSTSTPGPGSLATFLRYIKSVSLSSWCLQQRQK